MHLSSDYLGVVGSCRGLRVVVSGRGGMTVSVLTPPELTLDGDTWTLFTALEEAAEVMFDNGVSLCATVSDRE